MFAEILRRISFLEQNSFPAWTDSAGPSDSPPLASACQSESLPRPDSQDYMQPVHYYDSPPLEPLELRIGETTAGDDVAAPVHLLLAHAVAEEVRSLVPERLRICAVWTLVYSLERDGSSLSTLFHLCRDFGDRRTGFILVVRDSQRGTFGAYLSEHPHPAATYYGNGECFLWRTSTRRTLPMPPSADTTNPLRETTLTVSQTRLALLPPTASRLASPQPYPQPVPKLDLNADCVLRFTAFPYSGINNFVINCEPRFLSVGAGDGHYGLWLDDTLERGRSSRCMTFGNDPLSDEGEKFDVLGVELWAISSGF